MRESESQPRPVDSARDSREISGSSATGTMSADDLPPDRANRIADAIEDIERNVIRLREYQ